MASRNTPFTWFVVLSALALPGLGCSGDEPAPPTPLAGTIGSPPLVSGSGAAAGAPSGSAGMAALGGGRSPVIAAGAPAAVGGRSAPLPPSAAGGSGATTAPPPVPPAGQAGQSAMMPPAPTSAPDPSAGCNQADWPPAGNAMMDVDGTAREYILKLPANYDPKKAYRLVFAWHGLGGTAMQIAGGSFGGGYYGLAGNNRWANEAIFIAGQGLATMTSADGTAGGAGWPNTGGRDVAFVRKLVDYATTEYCIDRSRIFSVGMSYGGIMSNTLGCEMGDVFRAIAPMSGSGPRTFGGKMCVGQVGVWMSHGDMDTTVPTAQGQASRDHWAMANHCTTMTAPVTPDPCVAYQGCDAGNPVVWCQFAGGHMIPPFATQAIFDFLSQF